MMNRTINDPEADNAVIKNARDTLVVIGELQPEEVNEVSWFMNLVNNIAKILDNKLFEIFGTGGFKEGIFA